MTRAGVLLERQVVRVSDIVVHRLAVAAAWTAGTAIEELHLSRNYFSLVALLAVLAIPGSSLQASFNVDLAALLQELVALFR
jgi:hypothetical protein